MEMLWYILKRMIGIISIIYIRVWYIQILNYSKPILKRNCNKSILHTYCKGESNRLFGRMKIYASFLDYRKRYASTS